MRFDVITLFPQMFRALTDCGVVGRALVSGIAQLECWNPRNYTQDKHRRVDDRPYGGGPGMVMTPEPLQRAIDAAHEGSGRKSPVMFLSPQGRRLNQNTIKLFAEQKSIIFLAGRYEGIDQRVIDKLVDEEWSVGDYVLSGGELAAMVFIDAIVRTLPGALGHDESAQMDSFMSGLLDYPHYTRPEESELGRVPDVLLSGDHAAIERWRSKQAVGQTWLKRPDMLGDIPLSNEQITLLNEFIEEYESVGT